VLAIALGVASVVWVTCCYESVRRTIEEWAVGHVGSAQLSVTSSLGKYDQIPQRLAREVAKLEDVELVAPRLLQRIRATPWPAALIDNEDLKPNQALESTPDVDLHGIDVATEFHIRQYKLTEGRMIAAEDDLACVLDAGPAREAGLVLGDYLLIWSDTRAEPFELKIVGFFERKRIARFQKPVALLSLPALQRMRGKFALITTADVVLKDTSPEAVAKSAASLRRLARNIAPSATVRTAEARMKQVRMAESQQQFVVVLLSCVAMLTALFIILSTLSMGMVERVGQLGLMRCVGVTRGQLALLVMLEVLPIGACGVLLGIPIGLGFTALTVVMAPEYVGSLAISAVGLWLGAAAGMLTTVLAAILPAFAAFGVSPMEAARPRARRARQSLMVIAAVAAVAALLWQNYALLPEVRRSLQFTQFAAMAIVVLYLGYAFASPLAVRLVGTPSVWLVAAALRVRPRLLQDQVGHAVWRSAGVCCGVMVGLSLIVAVSVVNASVTRGWQFPKEFPEGYLWSFSQFEPGARRRLEGLEGLKEFTVANSINVIVEERPAFGEELLMSVTWFMGCEPESFMNLIKLDFIEGDQETALAKLNEGGHIVIADDFMRSRNKHVGDEVRVWLRSSTHPEVFKVAGVVRSPSIDIAAGYFQAQSEYSVVASGSVMGTNKDLRDRFKINGSKLVLLNFDLPADPPPADWPPPQDSPEGRALAAADYDEWVPRERRWRRHLEREVLAEVRRRVDAPQAFVGTVGELKDEIDSQLTELTRLFSAIPSVALLVAAIGVANLMMANVFARTRQLAIMRAVGATRGLIIRLVIGEALVLGLLGSALGLTLGLHLAGNITLLVERMWGFTASVELPWGLLAATITLTIALCIVAGSIPARMAARTNVVEALHVA
jgi:putative ABC transport system permease protein